MPLGRLRQRDRISLIALGGAFVAFGLWFLFAYLGARARSRSHLHRRAHLPPPDRHPHARHRRRGRLPRHRCRARRLPPTAARHRPAHGREDAQPRAVREQPGPDGVDRARPDRVLFANLRARHAAPVGLDVVRSASSASSCSTAHSAPCVNCGLQPVQRHARRSRVDRRAHRRRRDRHHWLSRLIYPVCSENGDVDSFVETVTGHHRAQERARGAHRVAPRARGPDRRAHARAHRGEPAAHPRRGRAQPHRARAQRVRAPLPRDHRRRPRHGAAARSQAGRIHQRGRRRDARRQGRRRTPSACRCARCGSLTAAG